MRILTKISIYITIILALIVAFLLIEMLTAPKLKVAYASHYPNDAIGLVLPVSGAGSVCPDILSATNTPRTLLYARLNSSTGGASSLSIGTSTLYLSNQSQNVAEKYVPIVYTNEALICTRQNNQSVVFSVVYVNYDLTKKIEVPYETIENASGTFYIDKTWSYGDLFIAFLLIIGILLFIFIIIFSFFFEPVFKIRGRQ